MANTLGPKTGPPHPVASDPRANGMPTESWQSRMDASTLRSISFGGTIPGRLTTGSFGSKTVTYHPVASDPRANGIPPGAGQNRVDASRIGDFGFVAFGGGSFTSGTRGSKTPTVAPPVSGDPHGNNIPAGTGELRVEGMSAPARSVVRPVARPWLCLDSDGQGGSMVSAGFSLSFR